MPRLEKMQTSKGGIMATTTRATDKEARMQRSRTIMASQQRPVSYSWEEFVNRLAQLDDPRLRMIGQKELAKLARQQQG
jgi:hypothetical protein